MRIQLFFSILASLLIFNAPSPAQTDYQDAGRPFGLLPLVDELLPDSDAGSHEFRESSPGVSRLETLLGRPCRILPNDGDPGFFAYRIGAEKGLQPGQAYVLTIDFPDDQPRSMFILNRGDETTRGLRTGAALGDVLYTYTDNNVASLQIPHSGKHRTWKMLFYLHDRFPGLELPRGRGPRPHLPEEGFWVAIAHASRRNAPLSAGAAISRIRLYAVPDPSAFNLRYIPPPEDLPKRHLFWREEMSDGVIDGAAEEERGVADELEWFRYTVRLMEFLGFNTFCKDLLEFGHNQGWDSASYGGNEWINESRTPGRWTAILDMLQESDFSVLPYYEYAGSIGPKGLGSQKLALPLNGNPDYTHIDWSEKAHADLTLPETLEDAKKVLDATIVRHSDKVEFLGAWFRTRPSHIPISFSDRALRRFSEEANAGEIITREELRADGELLVRYYEWWYAKRREFFIALRDFLRAEAHPDAVLFFTPDAAEPGRKLDLPGKQLVTDAVDAWSNLLQREGHDEISVVGHDRVVREDLHLRSQLKPPFTWDDWEWQHSVPPADPQRYVGIPGVIMTYPFHRAYSVESATAFDAFRFTSGLAAVRYYPLNEHSMADGLGYFASDVERAGPYCMLTEVRAMAHGDPRYIGYLTASRFNRGFPEYVRSFNAAFLSLPALPSEILPDASPDPEIVVRRIDTENHGTYLAIANTGLRDKVAVEISLPASGEVTDLVSAQTLARSDVGITLSFHPCQLRAIHISPK
jgi:hypothetical protein